jgi:hypothetical protein
LWQNINAGSAHQQQQQQQQQQQHQSQNSIIDTYCIKRGNTAAPAADEGTQLSSSFSGP